MLITRQKIVEALRWYIDNYSITNEPLTVAVTDEINSFFDARFGSTEEDGYLVTMEIHKELSSVVIVITDGDGRVTSYDEEPVKDLIYMNGAFNTFLLDSVKKLEDKAEEKYRKQQLDEIEIKDNNPLTVHAKVINAELDKLEATLIKHRNNFGEFPDEAKLEELEVVRKRLESIIDNAGYPLQNRIEHVKISSDPLA